MKALGKKQLGITIAVLLAFTVGSPVRAEESNSSTTMKTLAELTSRSQSAATSVLANLGKTELSGSGRFVLTARNQGVTISLPRNSSDSLQVISAKGDLIGVGLPFAENAASEERRSGSVVSYDNKNSSVTVPLIKDDGSLQLTTVLSDLEAPSIFDYEFTLPTGSRIVTLGQGLAFMNGNRFLGGLAAPWAKDSNGKDVPTRFSVEGTTVRQIVEHRSSKFAYPIVADPWLGLNIFSSIAISDAPQGGLPVVNLNLSTWGWSVYLGLSQGGGVLGFAAGQVILSTAGWDEAWGKGGAVQQALNKPSQRQQFDCHALGALTASDWNLEKFRLNRLNGNWRSGVLVHHCNWKTADGY
jgi:hypothetical protein